MAKQCGIKATGVVHDIKPGDTFIIKLDNDEMVTCYLAGKMRMHIIKVIRGDSVDIEMSPYDLKKGRITYRHK